MTFEFCAEDKWRRPKPRRYYQRQSNELYFSTRSVMHSIGSGRKNQFLPAPHQGRTSHEKLSLWIWGDQIKEKGDKVKFSWRTLALDFRWPPNYPHPLPPPPPEMDWSSMCEDFCTLGVPLDTGWWMTPDWWVSAKNIWVFHNKEFLAESARSAKWKQVWRNPINWRNIII